jgi:hypothetical protein
MATTLLSAGITMGSSTLQPGGSAPSYTARAWVNFDGTTATPSTIRGSGNVSSVTRNSTGNYTVNFATAMSDANFVANAQCDPVNTFATPNVPQLVSSTTTNANITNVAAGNKTVFGNVATMCVSFFR